MDEVECSAFEDICLSSPWLLLSRLRAALRSSTDSTSSLWSVSTTGQCCTFEISVNMVPVELLS